MTLGGSISIACAVTGSMWKASGLTTDLRGANLDRADLEFAKLKGADLTGASLREAEGAEPARRAA